MATQTERNVLAGRARTCRGQGREGGKHPTPRLTAQPAIHLSFSVFQKRYKSFLSEPVGFEQSLGTQASLESAARA